MSERDERFPEIAGIAEDRWMVTQTILASPELNAVGVYGNCIQAAVASAIGWPLDAVPHFGAFRDWDAALRLWAEGEEFVYRRHDKPMRAIPPGRCLYIGPSPRGYTHVVVGVDGKVAWDPHPSRDGLTAIDSIIELYRLTDHSSDLSNRPGSPPTSPTTEARS